MGGREERAKDNRKCFEVNKDTHEHLFAPEITLSQRENLNCSLLLGSQGTTLDPEPGGGGRRGLGAGALDLGLGSGSPIFQLCDLKQVMEPL